MKKNELKSLKGLSSGEIALRAKSLKKEIAEAIFDKNMKKLKDTKTIFKKRKDLARVLTILGQKQLIEELGLKVEDET